MLDTNLNFQYFSLVINIILLNFFQPFKNLPDARLDLAVGYHLPNPDVDDAGKILSMVQSTHPKVAALLTVMTPDLSPTLASLVLPL